MTGTWATRASEASSRRSWLRYAELSAFLFLFGWLAASAWLVVVELFDGYQNICNARFFLGYSDKYQVLRFPMLGLLLVPAEAVKQALELHPLNVRPHHTSTSRRATVQR